MENNLFITLAQQYSIVTAEIISKTGRLKGIYGDDKNESSKRIENSLQEAKELLEQMEFEARASKDRERLENQLKGHQVELNKLETDFKQAKFSLLNESAVREELFANDATYLEDQKLRLISNTEKLEKCSSHLDQGYKTCLETERMGTEMLEDLNLQRSTIQKSRDRLRQTHEKVGVGSRILTSMIRRSIQNRIVLAGVTLVFVITIIICIVIVVRKHS